MPSLFTRVTRWLSGKARPTALAGSQWSGSQYVDTWKRMRQPAANELLSELKGTAWTCISLNAAVCATYPPRLYVVTRHNDPRPRCLTGSLPPAEERRLRCTAHLDLFTKSAATIEEVTSHPLLDLLNRPNAMLNAFDLWELTQIYLEVHGQAYWQIQ